MINVNSEFCIFLLKIKTIFIYIRTGELTNFIFKNIYNENIIPWLHMITETINKKLKRYLN
jgi:hypothetical protein